VTVGISSIRYKGKLFNLADYPQLNEKVEKLIKKMQAQINTTVINGIKDSWDLSNKKNDVFVDKRLAGKRLNPKVRQVLYDPNSKALTNYLQRQEKGLGLSDRVWNLLDPFKKELEQGLGFGISKGQSAASMASDLKKYLVEPDKLFRRVRDEEGKLVLSKAARDYHPGQGVYRSSYKNALRVARTETNGAYRNADHERWNKLPFVTGIRIKLSNAHPRYDICDNLVGLYPKDFQWSGWHPQCICFATPEQMSDAEYDKIEDHLLAGQPISVPASQYTQQPPGAFGKYLQDNKGALARLKNPPYWMRDNPQYVTLKTPSPKPSPTPAPAPSPKPRPIVPPQPVVNPLPPNKGYDLDLLVNDQYQTFGFNMKETNSKVNQLMEKFPNMKREEIVAIDMYGNTSYRNVNSFLRNPDYFGPMPYEENFAKLLNDALDKMPSFEGTVYRGGDFSKTVIDEYREAFKKGSILTEKAFMSTSKYTGTAMEGDTFFVIESKSGKSVEEIMEFGSEGGANEAEVVFKAGSKFKVTEVRQEIVTDKWTDKKSKRTLIRLTEI